MNRPGSLDLDSVPIINQIFGDGEEPKAVQIAALEARLAKQHAQIQDLKVKANVLRAQMAILKIGGAGDQMNLVSPTTLFSVLACLLAGAAYLRTGKKTQTGGILK